MKIDKLNFEISPKIKANCYLAIVIGIIATIAAFMDSSTRGWVNILLNNFYFIALSLSGLFFLSFTGVISASWMSPYKRVPEAMMSFLPYGFVLMLVTYFGLYDLYKWSDPEIMKVDTLLMKKTAFLNTEGFMMRMVLYFILWIGSAKLLKTMSDRFDNEGHSKDLLDKTTAFSALTLTIFSFTFCLASFDWLMTIEPHWFSTIYGVYAFAGLFVSGISFITIFLIFAKDKGYFKEAVTEDHFHDLGKWMFGMSVFWAYIWISQYLLIWYSNIPEETEYYVLRSKYGWSWFFYLNLAINFFLPFFVLMTRKSKRSTFVLMRVGLILMVGHWLDLFVMIAPKIYKHHGVDVSIGLPEIGMFIGYAGLFFLVFIKSLSKRKIVSTNDPLFEEGVHLHQ